MTVLKVGGLAHSELITGSSSKIAEKKAVCRSVFLTALYFECQSNKNALIQTVFFADLVIINPFSFYIFYSCKNDLTIERTCVHSP